VDQKTRSIISIILSCEKKKSVSKRRGKNPKKKKKKKKFKKKKGKKPKKKKKKKKHLHDLLHWKCPYIPLQLKDVPLVNIRGQQYC